ncbi:hypothetical protein GCK32_018249, partial [Trichostrongylus colubriformis]
IWTPRNVRIIVGLQYVAALATVSPLIGAKLMYTSNIDGTFTYTGLDTQADIISKFTNVGVCVIYASVSVGVNIRLVNEWHRLSKLGSTSRYGRQEKGLLLYTLFVFASSILMCSQQFIKIFSIYNHDGMLKAWITMQNESLLLKLKKEAL